MLLLLLLTLRHEAGSVSVVASMGPASLQELSLRVHADEDARLVPWPRQNVRGQDKTTGKPQELERSATNGQLPSRPQVVPRMPPRTAANTLRAARCLQPQC